MIFHEIHDHYHFEDFASYELYRVKSGQLKEISEKVSFCVVDILNTHSDLPGAAVSPYYEFEDCQTDSGIHGISVGWADIYGSAHARAGVRRLGPQPGPLLPGRPDRPARPARGAPHGRRGQQHPDGPDPHEQEERIRVRHRRADLEQALLAARAVIRSLIGRFANAWRVVHGEQAQRSERLFTIVLRSFRTLSLYCRRSSRRYRVRAAYAVASATSPGSEPQWASGSGGESRRYHSASRAPMQPVPAAVTAWR